MSRRHLFEVVGATWHAVAIHFAWRDPCAAIKYLEFRTNFIHMPSCIVSRIGTYMLNSLFSQERTLLIQEKNMLQTKVLPNPFLRCKFASAGCREKWQEFCFQKQSVPHYNKVIKRTQQRSPLNLYEGRAAFPSASQTHDTQSNISHDWLIIIRQSSVLFSPRCHFGHICLRRR